MEYVIGIVIGAVIAAVIIFALCPDDKCGK